MLLKEQVRNQVLFAGSTPGGCRLTLKNLLDHGRDVFQFMQLFTPLDVEDFYYNHAVEIDQFCADDDVLADNPGMAQLTKFALEKVLMLIEGEMTN